MSTPTNAPFQFERAVDEPIQPGSSVPFVQTPSATTVARLGLGGYNDLADAVSRGMFRCYRVAISNRIAVTEAQDFGSLRLLQFTPNSPQLLLGGWVSLAFAKDNNANGIVAATVVNIALGTAAASAATLATTMINILNNTSVATTVTGTTTGATLAGGATPGIVALAAAADPGVWLNVGTGGITADSGISFTGEARIWALDLGAF